MAETIDIKKVFQIALNDGYFSTIFHVKGVALNGNIITVSYYDSLCEIDDKTEFIINP